MIMKVETDKEGAAALQGLCDVALKNLNGGGINCVPAVNLLLGSVKIVEAPAPTPEKPAPE